MHRVCVIGWLFAVACAASGQAEVERCVTIATPIVTSAIPRTFPADSPVVALVAHEEPLVDTASGVRSSPLVGVSAASSTQDVPFEDEWRIRNPARPEDRRLPPMLPLAIGDARLGVAVPAQVVELPAPAERLEVDVVEDEPQPIRSPAANSAAAERRQYLRSDRDSIKPIREFGFDDVFTRGPAPLDPAETPVPVNDPRRDPYVGTNESLDYYWSARNLSHRTLYFQEMPLQRYGYSSGPVIQPFLSAADFARDAVLFPLRRFQETPCELHYVLGLERAGSPAPDVRERWKQAGH